MGPGGRAVPEGARDRSGQRALHHGVAAREARSLARALREGEGVPRGGSAGPGRARVRDDGQTRPDESVRAGRDDLRHRGIEAPRGERGSEHDRRAQEAGRHDEQGAAPAARSRLRRAHLAPLPARDPHQGDLPRPRQRLRHQHPVRPAAQGRQDRDRAPGRHVDGGARAGDAGGRTLLQGPRRALDHHHPRQPAGAARVRRPRHPDLLSLERRRRAGDEHRPDHARGPLRLPAQGPQRDHDPGHGRQSAHRAADHRGERQGEGGSRRRRGASPARRDQGARHRPAAPQLRRRLVQPRGRLRRRGRKASRQHDAGRPPESHLRPVHLQHADPGLRIREGQHGRAAARQAAAPDLRRRDGDAPHRPARAAARLDVHERESRRRAARTPP